MTRGRWLAAALAVLALVGCQGNGDDDGGGGDDDGNAFHRPGQDCLRCHGFAVAGTIYNHAADTVGLQGADVTVTDAAGHSFTTVSNRAGNFYIDVRSGLSAPSPGRNGSLDIPWQPAYPFTVKLAFGGAEKVMRTQVHRSGACATCHGLVASATSVGRVFMADP